MGRDGMGWDGMGWDGTGWDGTGWDGMGWDGMGRDGMGWDGMYLEMELMTDDRLRVKQAVGCERTSRDNADDQRWTGLK